MAKIKSFFQNLKTKISTASIEKEESSNKVVKAYYSALAVVSATAAATSLVAAEGSGGSAGALDNIFNKVSESLQNIYTRVVGISTVVAVTVIAVCLLIRIFSKNPRSVEEATAWIKRAAITWFILNTLSYFLAYGRELAFGSGDKTTPDDITW